MVQATAIEITPMIRLVMTAEEALYLPIAAPPAERAEREAHVGGGSAATTPV